MAKMSITVRGKRNEWVFEFDGDCEGIWDRNPETLRAQMQRLDKDKARSAGK